MVVTTLTVLKRAHILFTSLQTFVAAGTISEIFVLVPAAEVELVKQEYACWQSLNIKVMAEDDFTAGIQKVSEKCVAGVNSNC